jgi:hypothetical protein
MSKPCIHYFNTGAWPVIFGFTDSVADLQREFKRMNCTDAPSPLFPEGKDGSTYILSSDGTRALIVCIPKSRKVSRNVMTALVVHEATHVWQEVCREMGEEEPGAEIEAYAIQWITQCILEVMK